ncbi:conserved hypothetical protein [Trichinella spiralis]|uniref:hypothetical protein n=1 Tax=Trichinella spiralis TaxID=6334 RepID=UPI0001EFD7E9|nr:conserved hypothetical protein [Trichinella spiralis]
MRRPKPLPLVTGCCPFQQALSQRKLFLPLAIIRNPLAELKTSFSKGAIAASFPFTASLKAKFATAGEHVAPKTCLWLTYTSGSLSTLLVHRNANISESAGGTATWLNISLTSAFTAMRPHLNRTRTPNNDVMRFGPVFKRLLRDTPPLRAAASSTRRHLSALSGWNTAKCGRNQ